MKEQYAIFDAKMNKVIETLNHEFLSIRAGRANPPILDKIHVDYYGVPTLISQMAAISVSEARTLVIAPWDKSMIKQIEKAINESDIGIHPQNDGNAVRLIFPPLTEERRRELSKTVAKYGEESKVSIRNVRRDAIDKFKDMKRLSEITEDDLKSCEKDMQDLTDKACKEIDSLVVSKTKEIMEV